MRKYSNTASSASLCMCVHARVCGYVHACVCVCRSVYESVRERERERFYREQKTESDNSLLRMFLALFGNSCEPEQFSKNKIPQ